MEQSEDCREPVKLSRAIRLGLGMATYLDLGSVWSLEFLFTIALPYHDRIFLFFPFSVAATHMG